MEKDIYVRKHKGIYLNSNLELSEEEYDLFFSILNNFSWKMLSKFYKSIHHVNIFKNELDELDTINIKLRKNGIKPEDIDLNYLLVKKKSKGELSDYEELLLKLANYHNNNLTKEEKIKKLEYYEKRIKKFQNKYNKLKNEIKN